MALLDDIRQALKDSEHSRYRISQETGIAESVLSRFASGERGLRVETAEVLAGFLGFELVARPKRRAKNQRGS